MKRLAMLAAQALAATLPAITCLVAQVRVAAGSLQLALNAVGVVTALRNTASGHDYLYAANPAPLLTLVSAGGRHAPTALAVSRSRACTRLTLDYADPAVRIVVRVRELPTHLAFDIVSATPE